MLTSHHVVVAITVPLLAYRVCEELYQIPGVEVLGPVSTAEDALALASCCTSPLILCDDNLVQALAPHVSAIGAQLVRMRLDALQAPEFVRLGTPELDLRVPTWSGQLRSYLAVDQVTAPASVVRDRRQNAGKALGRLLGTGGNAGTVAHDPETGLPTSATFGTAVAGLPQIGTPTAILFVDLTPVIVRAGKEPAWLAEAGKRLRRMLRQGDLVFRLDRALYAVLAPCPRPDRVPALRDRLRWMLCGSEFIAPEHIVMGDAYWTAAEAPTQVATAAWQSLQLQRARFAT